ncbi:MAG: hypothetical protein AAGB01_02425 [Cyanobacteria bacterium P01_F01_bin.42]
MKSQSNSLDASSQSGCQRPELRGNLILGLLLGLHLVISLPDSGACAYAQNNPDAAAGLQSREC